MILFLLGSDDGDDYDEPCPKCGHEDCHCEYYRKVDALEKAGHTTHCACRIVSGDGCCECGLDPTPRLTRLLDGSQ